MKLRTALSLAALGLAVTTAHAAVIGQLGILDDTANGGINPATGAAWAPGDTYRLVFVTSTTRDGTSANIADYNTFVQSAAASAGYGGVTWNMIGSTLTVDARDNTGTNPGTDGTGVGIFLMDGITIVAENNADLWNGVASNINLNESGVFVDSATLSGTNNDGTAHPDQYLGEALGGNYQNGHTNKPISRWIVQFNTGQSTSLPGYALSQELTVVPEPSTGLLGGLAGLFLLRRRRK